MILENSCVSRERILLWHNPEAHSEGQSQKDPNRCLVAPQENRMTTSKRLGRWPVLQSTWLVGRSFWRGCSSNGHYVRKAGAPIPQQRLAEKVTM